MPTDIEMKRNSSSVVASSAQNPSLVPGPTQRHHNYIITLPPLLHHIVPMTGKRREDEKEEGKSGETKRERGGDLAGGVEGGKSGAPPEERTQFLSTLEEILTESASVSELATGTGGRREERELAISMFIGRDVSKNAAGPLIHVYTVESMVPIIVISGVMGFMG